MNDDNSIEARRRRLIATCELQRLAVKAEMMPLMENAEVMDYWIAKIKRYSRAIVAVTTIGTIMIASRRSHGKKGLKGAFRLILPSLAPYLIRRLRSTTTPKSTGKS